MDHDDIKNTDAKLSDRDRAGLAALADPRSADDPSLRELRERVAADPSLAALVEEQRRVRSTVMTAAGDVDAPPSLRHRLEDQRQRLGPQQRRRRMMLGGGLAGALAVGVLAIVIATPSGVPGGPSLAAAAQAAQGPPTEPAPPQDPANPKLLKRAVDGVPFPDWQGKFKWRAVGSRVDRVNGRKIVTVIYENPTGLQVRYSIVPGRRIDLPTQASPSGYEGITFRVMTLNGVRIITWLRDGHTCVLSTRTIRVPLPKLFELAGWKGKGGVPF
jgi:hypothetical protein